MERSWRCAARVRMHGARPTRMDAAKIHGRGRGKEEDATRVDAIPSDPTDPSTRSVGNAVRSSESRGGAVHSTSSVLFAKVQDPTVQLGRLSIPHPKRRIRAPDRTNGSSQTAAAAASCRTVQLSSCLRPANQMRGWDPDGIDRISICPSTCSNPTLDPIRKETSSVQTFRIFGFEEIRPRNPIPDVASRKSLCSFPRIASKISIPSLYEVSIRGLVPNIPSVRLNTSRKTSGLVNPFLSSTAATRGGFQTRPRLDGCREPVRFDAEGDTIKRRMATTRIAMHATWGPKVARRLPDIGHGCRMGKKRRGEVQGPLVRAGPKAHLKNKMERTRRWSRNKVQPMVRDAWLVCSLNGAVGLAWLCGLGKALSNLTQYWLQVLFDGSCKSWGFEELKLEQFSYGRAAPKIKAAKWKIVPGSVEADEVEEKITTSAELELDLAFHAKEMAVRLCALPGLMRLPTRVAACGVMAEAVLLIQATFTVCRRRHILWSLLPSLPMLSELKFSFVRPPKFQADIRPATATKLASLKLGHIIDLPMLRRKIDDALMKLMGAPQFLTLNMATLYANK